MQNISEKDLEYFTIAHQYKSYDLFYGIDASKKTRHKLKIAFYGGYFFFFRTLEKIANDKNIGVNTFNSFEEHYQGFKKGGYINFSKLDKMQECFILLFFKKGFFRGVFLWKSILKDRDYLEVIYHIRRINREFEEFIKVFRAY